MKRIRLFCFDLDNTLYKPEIGLLHEIRKRIVEYVKNKMSVDEGEAKIIIKNWKKKYNSTLQGLIQEVGIEEYDYLRYIHDINLNDLLDVDNELKTALNLLEAKKVVLTDSYSVYANSVLKKLEISHCFARVYCTEDMNFFYKKQANYLKDVILKCCNELGMYDIVFSEILLVDDDYDSLCAAKEIGLKTAFISKTKNNLFDYNETSVTKLLQLYS